MRREQEGIGAKHTRPWRPKLGNKVPGKSTFRSAHQKPRPGEVEPGSRATAMKRAVCWSPQRTNRLEDAGERRLLWQQLESRDRGTGLGGS